MSAKSHIETINPPSFGKAIAPYSQATVAGNFVFVAGQVAFDGDNQVIAPGDAKRQTEAILERTAIILDEAGGSLEDIVTATVFLTDLDLFAAFNEGWSARMGGHLPARAAVRADLLIEGLVVEVQATAVLAGD